MKLVDMNDEAGLRSAARRTGTQWNRAGFSGE
jgi:hypothetical protein